MLKKIFSDKLIKAGSTLFLFSMVSNIFNYIFQVTMGRLLVPEEYGLMNSLLAMFMVIGIPLGTILMVISRQTAEYKAKGEFSNIRGLVNLSYKKVFRTGSVIIFFFFVTAPFIKGYIHAPSLIPVVILGLSIFASFGPLINIAVLQGVQDFRWMNLGVGLAGPLKFFTCVIMVLVGLSVSGVMGGILVTSLILWVITFLPLKKDIGYGEDYSVPHDIHFINTFPVLVANLAFAVMTQADMVLVKHLFSAHEAGIYASAAILGKAVMYLPGAVVFALFPMVVESNALRMKSLHLLAKAVIATLLLSGGGALLLFSFPRIIIGIFFGTKYFEAVNIVRYFSLAMLPMALLMIIMNYFIAKGRTLFSYIISVGAIIQVVMILLFSGSLMSVIYSIMSVGIIVLSIGIMLVFVEERAQAAQVSPKHILSTESGER